MEKKKALETALSQIDKLYGKGTVMRLGDNAAMNIDSIPTGSLALDDALGIGGLPRGRIVEIYGPESSGKTTLALHVIAEAQKRGGTAAFIDAEHALDPEYARKLGVDVDNLLVSQPDYGEQALAIAEALVSSGAIDVIVVDSVAALTPKNEIEGTMGDAFVGALARQMSQAMRKLAGPVSRSNTVAIFINQLREKIGVMYGNPEVTTGGKALKFYASVRLDIRKTETLSQSGEAYGSHVKVKVVKNKVAPPFKVVEFDINFGEGINRLSELIELGVKYNFIQKAGSWINMGDLRLGQGKDNAKKFLSEHPDIAEDLEKKIREAMKAAHKPSDSESKTDNGSEPEVKASKTSSAASSPVAVLVDDFDE